MAGAPTGNQNAKHGRQWRDAINAALEHRSRVDQVQALQKVAEKLIEKALDGDLSAIKELGDRIDGKAMQAVELSGENGEPIQVIERRIVDPIATRTK